MKENGGEKKIRVQKEIKTAREKVVGKVKDGAGM